MLLTNKKHAVTSS